MITLCVLEETYLIYISQDSKIFMKLMWGTEMRAKPSAVNPARERWGGERWLPFFCLLWELSVSQEPVCIQPERKLLHCLPPGKDIPRPALRTSQQRESMLETSPEGAWSVEPKYFLKCFGKAGPVAPSYTGGWGRRMASLRPSLSNVGRPCFKNKGQMNNKQSTGEIDCNRMSVKLWKYKYVS